MASELSQHENLEQQREEHLALESIYGSNHYFRDTDYDEAWLFVPETRFATRQLKLLIHIPADYPSIAPPIIELLVPNGWLSKQRQQEIVDALLEQYIQGEVVLFTWAVWLTDYIEEQCCQFEQQQKEEEERQKQLAMTNTLSKNHKDSLIDQYLESPTNQVLDHRGNSLDLWPEDQILRGEPIIDRKSTFIAHLATIHSTNDVDRVINTLLMDRKIARATHNISAYRILLPSSHVLQDCNDDGETAAGSRLLHLLQIVDARNVVVVVSRWYGGIQLGPDRFKHINNAARQLLSAHGFINDAKSSTTHRSKNK
ncbi:ribosomal protein S5 domain 2-type protein [Syncephalis fuscata]|nr:ribosomal protein S5 domain 2-type protein [Syncephalis fuscata]